MRKSAVFLCLAACASFAVSPAIAKDIKVGLSGTVTSVDPHFYNASPNNSIAMQIFDRLTERTAEGQLVEGLATKWEAVSQTKWRFTLREGVKWHDGKPFTADDVVFTLSRAEMFQIAPAGSAVSSEMSQASKPMEILRSSSPRRHRRLPFRAILPI